MENMLAGFRQDLTAHPYFCGNQTTGKQRWREFLPFTTSWNRLLLIIGSGLACIVVLMMIIFINQTPTWADVEKQFGSTEFYSFSVYVHDEFQSRPNFWQIWKGRNGQVRIHYGRQVAFAHKGAPEITFDVDSRRRGIPRGMLKIILRRLDRAEHEVDLSLKTIVKKIIDDQMIDTTSLVISDTQVSKDLLVFDTATRDNIWWVRIWALHESKLPVRIIRWHRKKGKYVEVLITYSQEQPAEFYEPEAFEAVLNDPSYNEHQLMHMFFRDPGGQTFPTPGS